MRATIDHPDGGRTTINGDLVAFRGCAGCWWGALILFLITAPAYYFAPPWAAIAYSALVVLFVAALVRTLRGHRDDRT